MKICPICNSSNTEQTEHISSFKLNVCDECGLRFFDENREEAINYDEIYATTEYKETHLKSLFNTNDWEKFAEYATFKPFFENLRPDNKKLIDIGCGVGRFCRAAYSKGWNVYGVDISKTAIEIGRKGVPFNLEVKNVDALVNSGALYDVVTCFEVLEHLYSPIMFLKQAQSILTASGTFFCTVPNIDSVSVRNSSRKDWLPPVHVLFFNQTSLLRALSEAGLKNIQIGHIWVNEPPKGLLRKIKYWISRVLGRTSYPEPLGLWAMGSKG